VASGGIIRSDRYPYLEVSLSIRGLDQTVWAYVDTGFEGFLTIPETERERIGRPEREATFELADGSTVTLGVYVGAAQILGLGQERRAGIVASGREYLLGRDAIDSLRVTFDRGRTLIAEL